MCAYYSVQDNFYLPNCSSIMHMRYRLLQRKLNTCFTPGIILASEEKKSGSGTTNHTNNMLRQRGETTDLPDSIQQRSFDFMKQNTLKKTPTLLLWRRIGRLQGLKFAGAMNIAAEYSKVRTFLIQKPVQSYIMGHMGMSQFTKTTRVSWENRRHYETSEISPSWTRRSSILFMNLRK